LKVIKIVLSFHLQTSKQMDAVAGGLLCLNIAFAITGIRAQA
jgi:hypothetical protein